MAGNAEREQVRLYFYQEDHRRVLKSLGGRERANLFRMLFAKAMRSGEMRLLLDQLGYESDKLLEGTSAPPRGVVRAELAEAPAALPLAAGAAVAPSPVQAQVPAQKAAAAPTSTSPRVEAQAPAAAPIAIPEDPPLQQKVPPKLKLTGFFGEKPRPLGTNP